MEQSRNIIVDYIEALVIAVILALFIRAFIVQAYTIPSGSMKDTLLIGDFLLVNKFAYGIKIPFTNKTIINTGEPQHGDIIVFANPNDPDKEDYIKRVVGLPGDVLEMRDHVLYRNGEKVDESYLRELVPYGSTADKSNFASITVPPDSFFMMGDNRDESWDSRGWGFVPREKLIGKAWRIYWSWDKETSSVRWGRIGSSMQTLSKQ
ncbi:signal peptidase I [Desulfovibrio litoralis]